MFVETHKGFFSFYVVGVDVPENSHEVGACEDNDDQTQNPVAVNQDHLQHDWVAGGMWLPFEVPVHFHIKNRGDNYFEPSGI